jgi:hypothetical protein
MGLNFIREAQFDGHDEVADPGSPPVSSCSHGVMGVLYRHGCKVLSSVCNIAR